MKRSEINQIYQQARKCFESHGWALPPDPLWDITDFGFGYEKSAIALINLAVEAEYCEKIIYCSLGKPIPMHAHLKKKEDIICRWGIFGMELWSGDPSITQKGVPFTVKKSGKWITYHSGDRMDLHAGERITLPPGIYHSFWSTTPEVIIGEVSTANDDLNDNIFTDPEIGRFPEIIEDEPPLITLISDKK